MYHRANPMWIKQCYTGISEFSGLRIRDYELVPNRLGQSAKGLQHRAIVNQWQVTWKSCMVLIWTIPSQPMEHILIKLTKLFFPFLFGLSLNFFRCMFVRIINSLVNDFTPRTFIRRLLSLLRTMANSSLRLRDHLPPPIHQCSYIPENAWTLFLPLVSRVWRRLFCCRTALPV